MLVKQTEMDAVAKLIYEALEEKTHLQDTLFILLGDHGMTEQGNHGGGSTSEIASAMVFISPKFMSGSRTLESPLPASPNYEYYSVINQIDLVPTIAGLMGFTTPSTSLGVFPADMLDVFTKPEDRLRAISKNALQLKDLLDLEHGPSQLINASCHDAFEAGEVMVIKDEVLCAFEAMKIAQQKLEAGDDISIEEVLVATRKVRTFLPLSLTRNWYLATDLCKVLRGSTKAAKHTTKQSQLSAPGHERHFTKCCHTYTDIDPPILRTKDRHRYFNIRLCSNPSCVVIVHESVRYRRASLLVLGIYRVACLSWL